MDKMFDENPDGLIALDVEGTIYPSFKVNHDLLNMVNESCSTRNVEAVIFTSKSIHDMTDDDAEDFTMDIYDPYPNISTYIVFSNGIGKVKDNKFEKLEEGSYDKDRPESHPAVLEKFRAQFMILFDDTAKNVRAIIRNNTDGEKPKYFGLDATDKHMVNQGPTIVEQNAQKRPVPRQKR